MFRPMKSNGKLHDSNGLASDPVIPYSRAADKASQETKSDRKKYGSGKPISAALTLSI